MSRSLQQQIYVTTVKLCEDLSPPHRDRLRQQYIGSHPEKNLIACVLSETLGLPLFRRLRARWAHARRLRAQRSTPRPTDHLLAPMAVA